METLNHVSHQRLPLNSSYEVFRENLKTLLQTLEPDWPKDLMTDPGGVKKHVEALGGQTGLMIFAYLEFGELLNLYGKAGKTGQYLIGNPLTALEMAVHDIRAALYAPIRLIVYEDTDGRVYAEYDLPSTQFGQFGAAVLAVAKALDKKFESALRMADGEISST